MINLNTNQKKILSLSELQEEDINIKEGIQPTNVVINQIKEENEKIVTTTPNTQVVVNINQEQEQEQEQEQVVDEKVALLANQRTHVTKKSKTKICLRITTVTFRIIFLPFVAIFAFFRWLLFDGHKLNWTHYFKGKVITQKKIKHSILFMMNLNFD
jgi:hypothetical protein